MTLFDEIMKIRSMVDELYDLIKNKTREQSEKYLDIDEELDTIQSIIISYGLDVTLK